MSTQTKSTKSVSSTRTSNAGLTALVKEVSAFLDKAEPRLGPEPPALTGEEKRRTAKPRKGAEKIISTLAPIVQQHGLESPGLSADTMMARLSDAQTLQPLQTRLQKIQKRVDDELFSAQGDAWGMGLQFYSLLQRRAKGDGELATNLEPITRMFEYRHPVVKATKPTKVQTRAKAKLKKAVALATRHDVAGGSAPVAASPVPAPAGEGASAQSAPAPTPAAASAIPAGQYVPVATLAVATGSAAPAAQPAASAAPVTATPASSASPASPATGTAAASASGGSTGH